MCKQSMQKKRDAMDKFREWVIMHITIPIQAILLYRQDLHDEIQKG